ncbi:cadherin-like beta sandwich domain-containing protein [Aminipila butyrica]|uniref:Cadherin-like beta sandwich domain-containing protein n=1 Tax=Aminipila butyrica TaxID=433296 RepID=A0A858BV00_9FIRM|nr:cadherin-like beta sandwich domain-containing protein [Aminipila butyrica]QIB69212.1 cadherin-like beta sandwich domain-containing protein [Aminipila butyrica]
MKKMFSGFLSLCLVVSSGSMAFGGTTADESLSKLLVSKSSSTSSSKLYDMFPAFDPEIADYTVFLPDGADSAYLYMKPDDSDYTVYCDGEAIDEDDDYFALIEDIDDGDEIDIKVEDEDGDGDTLDTYTVTFYCGDEDDSDDVYLDSLVIKNKTDSGTYTEVELNKDFDEGTTSYTADISSNTYKTARIYAEASDTDAHVLINGEPVNSSGYVELSLQSGSNKIEVTVVAENCEDTKTYIITAAYEENVEAVLTGLAARDGGSNTVSLSPTFYSSKENYTTNVSNSVDSISFYLSTDELCNLYINDVVQSRNDWTQNYILSEGTNTFKVGVKSTTGTNEVNTYTISVYRQPASLEASVSGQKMTIDGVSRELNAYNINGNNFVKLRDLASLLLGTSKQFSVSYDETSNRIALLSGGYYTSVGQENMALGQAKEIAASQQSVYLDNGQVSLMTYNIDGNNYVMLRDVAMLLNFGLSYDSVSDTIQTQTTQSYSAS